MKISELKTPAFLVHLPKLKSNIHHMKERARKNNVFLRPHVKTHKTVEIARMQVSEEFQGITVSTLAEAHFFQKAGFEDIAYAFPITPNKVAEAAELAGRMKSLHLLLDQETTAIALESFGRDNNVGFSVFLKVDCGYHRAGVDPTSSASVQLVEKMQTGLS